MVNFAAPELLQCLKRMAYWLMKSEPDAYSIDDLERDGREKWDGIRNYQARNMMRDEMRIGDKIFFQDGLDGMILLRRGNRLSIMPVDKRHWDLILGLE
jgi:predicted RNA-binding protein with PUA-like domain